MENSDSAFDVRRHLLAGHAIPAHPLALTSSRAVDERSQRALTRYYVAAGAGGMAVGVHTTGFPIHDRSIGLYEPVLALAAETASEALARESGNSRDFVRVAGLVGNTQQAVAEARIALRLGYHCGLLSLGSWRNATDSEILAHCREVAAVIPLFGFYLQPAVGGRTLNYSFWRDFVEIPEVVAIKVAPFNRYATLDVVRALSDAGRKDVALYTGNDDAIVSDLITDVPGASPSSTTHFVGGLLGQWAVWTSNAVAMLREIQKLRASGASHLPRALLTHGAKLTEANAAIFDVAHDFAGCLPGILHVLQRQGLVATTLTFDSHEALSPGQAEAIERVEQRYPELTDNAFIGERIDEWMR